MSAKRIEFLSGKDEVIIVWGTVLKNPKSIKDVEMARKMIKGVRGNLPVIITADWNKWNQELEELLECLPEVEPRSAIWMDRQKD